MVLRQVGKGSGKDLEWSASCRVGSVLTNARVHSVGEKESEG